MYSNWTLPLDAPLDAQCGYSLAGIAITFHRMVMVTGRDVDLNPTCVYKSAVKAAESCCPPTIYNFNWREIFNILDRQREVLSQSNNDDKMDSFDHFLTEDKVKTINYYL